jgi:hypothetical protein
MSGFLVALQALRNQTPHHREPCVTVEERPLQAASRRPYQARLQPCHTLKSDKSLIAALFRRFAKTTD